MNLNQIYIGLCRIRATGTLPPFFDKTPKLLGTLSTVSALYFDNQWLMVRILNRPDTMSVKLARHSIKMAGHEICVCCIVERGSWASL
jgi:hypothetical protein